MSKSVLHSIFQKSKNPIASDAKPGDDGPFSLWNLGVFSPVIPPFYFFPARARAVPQGGLWDRGRGLSLPAGGTWVLRPACGVAPYDGTYFWFITENEDFLEFTQLAHSRKKLKIPGNMTQWLEKWDTSQNSGNVFK